MARYDAQINLLVSGQRELDRLADRLRSIEKQIVDINMLGVKPQQRDPVTGRFGADPDRQNRIQLARIQRIGREEERRSRLTSARVREQNSELERSILLQSRLNSAVDLYERKLEELSRGGGGAKLSESLKGQIKDIQAAYDAATAGGTKNLSIVRSLATELGRVVERQNEINRLSSFQSKSFFDAQRFERRIAELRRAGASASAFGGVGSQIRELRSAQARGSEFEAKDASRRIKESLDRIARELDGTIRQAKIENTARKAARSWEKFFEDAGANSLRLRQNQKDASVKLKNFFEDAATQALQISQNAKETRRSWQSFFDDAATQAFQISQNAKNTKQSWQSFFEDAANQALQISQNAKDTRRSWQEFFEDAQREADRLREGRLSRFARLRGRPDQYGEEAGPLPPGGPGAPRYFQEARQLSSQLLDVEAEIGRIRQESLNESLRLETKRLSLAKEYKRQVADALLEAVTFGKGSQVKRVAKDIATGGQNALVRGGLGLGALGISGAYVGAQEALSNLNFGPLQGQAVKAADAIGNAINSSLGGIPEIVNQMLSALGNIPSSLGLATVAALAFAPAMKTAGEAVFLAGKKFGQTKFGENVKLTLNRQTNLFESAINAASQMTMPIDASGFERNLEVRQSGKETADSWRSFFEEAAYLGLQLKQDSKDTATKWSDFFKDASYQALQISQNSKNTRKSWQAFFEDAAYEAFSIRQGSKDTASSWKLFFENAAYEAFFIRQNSKKTAEAWRSFFEEAAYEALSIRQKSKETAEAWGVFFADAAAQALEIKQNLKKTAESWRTFFLDAASETLRVSQEAKNTANNWKSFFENAAYQALQIKQNSKETGESWKVFFEDAAYEAFSIKEKAKLTRSSWERFFEEAELEAKRLRGGSQTGLQGSLKRLEEARGARQKFLGDVSAPEAIDKIVREFNKDSATGTASEAAQAAENVVGTYTSKIAAGVPAVADAMMKLGKAGIDAIKKALGIASPSKVMLAIAKNQIDTYVDFLKAALPQVEAAAKAIGEAGTPKPAGVPESAIRKPITEKARTRPLTAEQLDRNSAIAEYAASQITGPMGQFEQVKRKIEDFIDKTRTSVDLDKLFGGQEDERFAMATRGTSAGPEFDKIRAALADFYQIPAELTPDLERGVKAAGDASGSADELARYVSELTTGIEQIGVLLQSAAKLPIPTAAAPAVAVDDEFTRAQEAAAKADAAAAEAARKKAEAQKPFEASIQRAAELDAEAKRKADAAVSSVVQAQIEADAKAGAEAISKAILDPIESAAPEGERQVRSAIGNLFDRVAGVLGFGGAGGGGRPPVPPTGGGGGPTRDPGDFGRRLSTAAEQGAEALLGLRELRDPTKATTVELEALSGVLKEFRKILDPTVDGFERLDQQLRESAANLDLQLERRAPDAGFLTRKFDPRVARGLSEGLIGGAFPLLFGQGIGASIGGAAGGFGGGFAGGGLGFGLSLVGTAAGTAIDATVQSAIDLGKALENPTENFQVLADRSLISSKALEKQIEKTIEAGNVATASALIQEDLIKRLGSDGVAKLKAAAEASDRLNRVWSELTTAIQTAIAGPLAGFLEWVKSVVDAAGQRPKQEREIKETFKQLPDKYQEEFNKEVQRRIDAIRVASPATGSQPSLGSLQGVDNGLPRRQGVFDNALSPLEITPLITPQAIQDIRAQVAKEFESKKVPVAIEVTKEQLDQGVLNALEKELEAINIIDSILGQVRSANREQEDLDKQRAELVRSYEKSIGDIRKRIEDEVKNRRLAILETENQILDQQGQNRISQLRLINQQFVASAGQGQRPEVEDAAKRAAQIVAQFTEQQLSAEEEAAQVKRNAALDALKFDTQAAEFKANIEKEVSRLNIETARRIADINQQVARRNEDASKRRFEIEKQIAQIQLERVVAEFKGSIENLKKQIEQYKAAGLDEAQPGIIAGRNQIAVYEAQMKEYNKAIKKIGAISPPQLRGITEGSIGGQGVSTNQLEAVISKQKDRTQKLVDEILSGIDLTKATDVANFKNQIADLAKSFNAPIAAFTQNFNDELQASSRYIELLNQGLKGTTAQQVIQLEQQRAITIAQYNQAIASLEQRKNAKETSELAKGNIESQIVDLQNARDALLGAVSTSVKDVVLNQSIITAREAMKAMKEEMNELLDKVNQAKFASETIGQGIAGGVKGSISAVTGLDTFKEKMTLEVEINQLRDLQKKAKREFEQQLKIQRSGVDNTDGVKKASENYQEYTKRVAEAKSEMEKLSDTGRRVQQVLADMLMGIADAFLEMAQKIIAQQLSMIFFGTILKSLGINAGPKLDMSKSGITESTLAPVRQYPVLEVPGVTPSAKGSYFANDIAAFANGGVFTNSVVSSPTLFKFADGGALRTGVMGEADPEAIMPLKRGPGGRLGVDASGSGGDNITVTVNVDAKGSSVQGDDQRGNQLGRAISAAVQQELIKQKRPGGLLA